MSRQPSIGETLRRAYENREDCPPPEIYLDLELARLSPEERRWVEEHAERCPACGSERELARLFDRGPAGEGAERRDVERIVERVRSSRRSREVPAQGAGRVLRFPRLVMSELLRKPAARLAAAAVLVAALGVGIHTLRPAPPPLPAPGEDVPRGGTVEALEPAGPLAELPFELSWRPVDGAASYRVELLAVDDQVLWEEKVESPPVTLPPALRLELRRAVEYRWRVEAFGADDLVVASSRAVSFRAMPAPRERPPGAR